MEKDAALLIVDLQNDFCPGGALQVPDGDRIVGPVNRAAELFASAGLPVLASRDWHPPDTAHFRDYGGLWPLHCVQGTSGADFHPSLRLPAGTIIFSKGINPALDGYSAFEGVTAEGVGLDDLLRELGVRKLYVCGLATDYCVVRTVIEALKSRFEVSLLTDAVAGVDLVPGDSASAIKEMLAAGAQPVTVEELEGTPGIARQ